MTTRHRGEETVSIRHLWEIDHPYYGSSYNDSDMESFAELREHLDAYDADMNFIYRWDWKDYTRPEFDDLFVEGKTARRRPSRSMS